MSLSEGLSNERRRVIVAMNGEVPLTCCRGCRCLFKVGRRAHTMCHTVIHHLSFTTGYLYSGRLLEGNAISAFVLWSSGTGHFVRMAGGYQLFRGTFYLHFPGDQGDQGSPLLRTSGVQLSYYMPS